MADCGSEVEFKNEKNYAYDENNKLAIDVNYDFFTSFWRTNAVVTSHFAPITLTDFAAKTRLLDRDVNLMCQFNCIIAAFINTSHNDMFYLYLVYLDNITDAQMPFSL